jgi:ribosomal protein S18 acetylase RimI-like enzyme
MEWNIRRATPGDANSVAHIQVVGWKTTYSGIVPPAFLDSMEEESRAASWKEHLENKDALILVAENSSELFGFVCGGGLREPIEDYDGELFAIYLLPEFQRQGAGRQLVLTLAQNMRDRGFKRMVVWVLEQNSAVSFYKRMGGVQLVQKQTEIGGAMLGDLAFGFDLFDPRLYTGSAN